MRQGVYKTIFAGFVLLSSFWLQGCGSGDVLDEPRQRYQAYLTVEDVGEETLTIDSRQALCGTDAATAQPEDFTDAFGIITVNVAADAPGLTLDHYTLEYIPLPSPDGTGALITPPDLTDPGEGFFIFDAPAGSSSEFTITLLNVETKEEYENMRVALPTLEISRYTVRVTLYFVDEFDENRTIELERTILLGPYNNC